MTIHAKIAQFFQIYRISRKIAGSLKDIPRINDIEQCYGQFNSSTLGLSNSSTLDMGCGTIPRNPFGADHSFGIDIRDIPEKNIKRADLTIEPIPYADNTFNFITAFDFLEHIPRTIYSPERRHPFINLMNEVWRTLKPGGIFFSHTPIYPYSEVFRDPTHVNIFTHETFPLYFDDTCKAASMYGFIGSFKILGQYIKEPHLISFLQKN